jgi:hypothetical protein
MSSFALIAIFFSQSIGASLSLFVSTFIIYKISRSRTKLTSPYSRFIFGLSAYNAFFSFVNVFSSIPLPKDAPDVWGALGNETTCHIQGLLFAATIVSIPFYNLSLCIYSLCVIKHSMTDEDFSRRIEPYYLHAIPFIFGSFSAIYTSLSKGYVNTTCFITSESKEGNECSKKILLYLIVIPYIIVLMTTMLFMGMICWTVWMQDRTMDQYRFRAGNSNSSTSLRSSRRGQISRSRQKVQAAKSRALHYFVVYLATCGPSLAVIIIGGEDYQYQDAPVVLLILSRFLFHLQGFLNVCIHLHPQVKSIRKSNTEFSYIRGFYLALKTYDDGLDERRYPRLRRMSGRLSMRLNTEQHQPPAITADVDRIERSSFEEGQENHVSSITEEKSRGDEEKQTSCFKSGKGGKKKYSSPSGKESIGIDHEDCFHVKTYTKLFEL